MRLRTHELEGLLELPNIRDVASRRASFRQAFAQLARDAHNEGPSPLDGVSPTVLARSIRVAIEEGFFDDLEWLSPSSVGVALYEIGAALPNGLEKRDIGRRVLARVTEASAEVFAAIATRMALGSRKWLPGSAIRARISLAFAAPPTLVDAGPLAFALVSRRQLARDWIATPSTGSLPARRLAARILERAAAVAARRAAQGDDYAPRVFATEAVAGPFARLLADREPLVWRHAAIARGILAGVAPAHWKATVESLYPRLSPTEWRRGAVSLAASVATAPERASLRARDLLAGPLPTQDRGLVASMVWGLPRALETEPEAAESLLKLILDHDVLGAVDGLVSIARESTSDAATRVLELARTKLEAQIAATKDKTQLESQRMLMRELSPDRAGETTLRDAVSKALLAFVEVGARDAFFGAVEALKVARGSLDALEGLQADETGAMRPMAARTAVTLLRDIDSALLEESSLENLLMLTKRSTETETPRRTAPQSVDGEGGPLDDLHDRLGAWLVRHERRGPGLDASATAMSGRRLRALLHLVDAEGTSSDDDADLPRVSRIRARRVEIAGLLLERLVRERETPLHRTLCATLARALDALVREGACEPVDVMLVVGSALDHAQDVATLAEASMTPDVEGTLGAWVRFSRTITDEPAARISEHGIDAGDELPVSSRLSHEEIRSTDPLAMRIESMLELAAALGDDGSGRADALRGTLSRMARALQSIAEAQSRRAIVESGGGGLDPLATALLAYAQSEAGARQRVFGGEGESPPASAAPVANVSRLSALLARLGDASEHDARAGVEEALTEIRRALPSPLAALVRLVFERALSLPLESSENAPSVRIKVTEELPAWLGARRTIGGFFVVRPLGGGGAASVFVAKRIEERQDSSAEQFALKVPDYDGAAARSLSEQEFLNFFRAEASALLGLPPAQNLARFVTFDLAARPKPILVMELIEGPTLERFLATSVSSNAKQKPTLARSFDILDGVLAGLDLMHKHAIGHLDVKPSNVILREGTTPALVDFGLAGRHVRPGCATGPYGAPEVWGAVPDDFVGQPSPMPADVYAFGALAFEVLTGETLFDADSEIAIIGKHLSHDGDPPGLARLSSAPALVKLLGQALRRDPRARITVPTLRAGLATLGKTLGDRPWPLGS